jgi:hypothetical protein
VTRDDFAGTTKTKIASYLNDHSWYRNTLMETEKEEMSSCWDLDPIGRDFINCCKPF